MNVTAPAHHRAGALLFPALLIILLVVTGWQSLTAEQLSLSPPNASASIHAVAMSWSCTAPSGWTLDTVCGARQGMPVCFYPRDEDWEASPMIMYARTSARTVNLADHAMLLEKLLGHLRSQNDGERKVTALETVALDDGRSFRLFRLDGAANGGIDAVAFLDEAKSINWFGLTARDRAAFDTALPAFRQLIGSYRVVAQQPATNNR